MTDQLLQLIVSQTWQIAALASVVAIVNRTVAKNRPHLAHALWMLVLIKCVTPPIWGHSLGLFSQLQAVAFEKATAISEHGETASIELSHEPGFQRPFDGSESVDLLATDSRGPELEREFESTHIATASDSGGSEVQGSANITVPQEDGHKLDSAASASSAEPEPIPWSQVVLATVLLGAVVTFGLMIVRCVRCLRLIHRHRTTEFDAMLDERLRLLAKQLRMRRIPKIIVSDVLFGPAVLRLLRHTIVLPRCLLESSSASLPGGTVLGRSFLPERTFAEGEPARRALDKAGLPDGTECTQVAASREVLPGRQDLPKPLHSRQDLQFLDPILAHELLHIRRGDLRTGTLQAIAQSLWWFHPAVWLCNRWLSREAERCCDEQVIAELGCSPAQYARSLLSVIESKHQLQPVPVFPGMKPVEITSQRMERIMSLKSNLKKQTPLWCWLAIGVLAVVVLPGAIAKPATDEPKPAEEEKLPTTVKTVGDSADAIRLNSDFDLSGDLKPETVVAFVNDKPVRVSDVVQIPFVAGRWLLRSGDSPAMHIDTAVIQNTLRELLPQFLYDELVVQHYLATMSTDQQANVLKSLEEHFQRILKSIKANENVTTDEQLEDRLAEEGTSIEKLRQSFVRYQIVDGYAQALPADSPLRDKEAIIKTCRSLIDDCHDCLEWDVVTLSEPVLEVRDEGAVKSIVPKLPVPTEIAESTDRLLKLVWEARDSSRRRPLSTFQHTPWQIMHGVLGLRHDALVKDFDNVVNALEWIQSGWSFRGENWFQKTEHGGQAHPFSQPYLFEGHINQFAAILASCRLPLDATFETAGDSVTMRDIISNAKMTANDREEVTWTLLTLCRYLPPDAKWTNAKGEEWSIERLVEVEVGKTVGGRTSPNGGTCGLYSLAVARNEYLKTGKPLEGVWLKADEKIKKHIDLARSQQNSDGSLSSDFFRSGKRHENFDRRLASSGHILQLLMHAISEEELKEDWIRRAVETTANDILEHRKEYVSCDPLFTATEALTTYLERVTNCSIGYALPSPKREETSVESLNSAKKHSPKVPVVSAETSRDDRLIVIAYNVGDLMAQFKTIDVEVDFSPLVELIKTSIDPESWEAGSGTVFADQKTNSLVIRQTQNGHDGIQKILSQLRKSQDSVQITCRLMKLDSDSQLKGLEERCSLHPLGDRQRWALLTKTRTEGLVQFLADEKVETLSAPRIMTISGQPALVEVGSWDNGKQIGFRLSANPLLIADSEVIRLSHSVTIGEVEEDSQVVAHESLVGSGQTLLLIVEKSAGIALDRYVVLLTPEHLEEAEAVIAP